MARRDQSRTRDREPAAWKTVLTESDSLCQGTARNKPADKDRREDAIPPAVDIGASSVLQNPESFHVLLQHSSTPEQPRVRRYGDSGPNE